MPFDAAFNDVLIHASAQECSSVCQTLLSARRAMQETVLISESEDELVIATPPIQSDNKYVRMKLTEGSLRIYFGLFSEARIEIKCAQLSKSLIGSVHQRNIRVQSILDRLADLFATGPDMKRIKRFKYLEDRLVMMLMGAAWAYDSTWQHFSLQWPIAGKNPTLRIYGDKGGDFNCDEAEIDGRLGYLGPGLAHVIREMTGDTLHAYINPQPWGTLLVEIGEPTLIIVDTPEDIMTALRAIAALSPDAYLIPSDEVFDCA